MHYTARFFRENMPDWKKKKDPILSKLFYRRLSFYLAAFLANRGVEANSVSYFSTLVGILACILFIPNYWHIHILGAICVNIWLILDCTDGDLARSVKSQLFGEFADGISSYILVGFLCTAMGVATFYEGGIIFHAGNHWMIFIGAIASSADTMMRLIYQKYKATEHELADKGMLQIELDDRNNHSKVGSLRMKIETEFGIGGILPLLILIASIVKALDIVILYCVLYYGLSCAVVSILYIRKAVYKANEYEKGKKIE